MVALKSSLVVFLAILCSFTHAYIRSDTWIQISVPQNPPTARHSHSAVFDPVHGSMITFGGQNGNAVYDDISTYTVQTDTWATMLNISGYAPRARYGHSAVATGLNRMIIFGGRNNTALFNDVAILDMVNYKWLNIATTGSPPPRRAYHTAVVDRYQHAMYVYGGTTNGADFYNDMYVLDLDLLKWSRIIAFNGTTGGPRAMHSALMTLDGVMVLFGGIGRGDVACFNVRTNAWFTCVDPNATLAPTIRYGHTVVYSPLQAMVVYGGLNEKGVALTDVLHLDLKSDKTFTNSSFWNWTRPDVAGTAIAKRCLHTAVATPFGTMIIFGGIDGQNYITNDFGLYNVATTVLHSANDGAVLVIFVTLLGTIVIALCFAMDYMKEKSEEELIKARNEKLLLPKLPPIPKALQIPLGPRAQRFLDEFKMSLDPLQTPK